VKGDRFTDSSRFKIAEIVKRYCDQLKQMGIHVERAILFGSHAHGSGTNGSDIDLLIVSPNFVGMNTRARLELLGIAAARLWQPIEAFGYTADELADVEPATLLEEILRTGVPVAQ